jgi:NAD(P)-dependent dehydrogenase (short-subunit alcohol dehydrogenase family)
MAGDFAGRTALVTGASRGIGRAIAREFAARGADVALVYRSRSADAAETAKSIEAMGRRALPIQADVADAARVEAAFEEAERALGPIDLLAHSAGADTKWSSVRDLAPAEFARYVAVDLLGAYNAIHAAVRRMHGRGRGSIVAISSIAAQMCQARNAQGAAAKAGLEALVRVVAREEGRYGIRANVVAVGLTDTDQARVAFERWGKEATDRVIAAIPLQRIARPEEVAGVVAFLAGEGGAYVTGKVVQVDGGQIISG